MSDSIRQGALEADLEAQAVVVNYSVEKVVQGEVQRVGRVQRIRVHGLGAERSMAQLAAEILKSCGPIIHASVSRCVRAAWLCSDRSCSAPRSWSSCC